MARSDEISITMKVRKAMKAEASLSSFNNKKGKKMARGKKPMTKADQEKEAEALRARKERDAKFNYKYSPCPYCGQAVRWRLPQGVPETPEMIEKYERKHCGSEECQKFFAEAELKRRRGE